MPLASRSWGGVFTAGLKGLYLRETNSLTQIFWVVCVTVQCPHALYVNACMCVSSSLVCVWSLLCVCVCMCDVCMYV